MRSPRRCHRFDAGACAAFLCWPVAPRRLSSRLNTAADAQVVTAFAGFVDLVNTAFLVLEFTRPRFLLVVRRRQPNPRFSKLARCGHCQGVISAGDLPMLRANHYSLVPAVCGQCGRDVLLEPPFVLRPEIQLYRDPRSRRADDVLAVDQCRISHLHRTQGGSVYHPLDISIEPTRPASRPLHLRCTDESARLRLLTALEVVRGHHAPHGAARGPPPPPFQATASASAGLWTAAPRPPEARQLAQARPAAIGGAGPPPASNTGGTAPPPAPGPSAQAAVAVPPPPAPALSQEGGAASGGAGGKTAWESPAPAGPGKESAQRAEGNASPPLASECVVCMDAQRSAAAVPCGHMCACYECLQGIHAAGQGCPVCRQPIQQVVRIYSA